MRPVIGRPARAGHVYPAAVNGVRPREGSPATRQGIGCRSALRLPDFCQLAGEGNFALGFDEFFMARASDRQCTACTLYACLLPFFFRSRGTGHFKW